MSYTNIHQVFENSTHTLSYLHDKIIKGFDSGLLTGMVFIGLQKAFDTIDQNILIVVSSGTHHASRIENLLSV